MIRVADSLLAQLHSLLSVHAHPPVSLVCKSSGVRRLETCTKVVLTSYFIRLTRGHVDDLWMTLEAESSSVAFFDFPTALLVHTSINKYLHSTSITHRYSVFEHLWKFTKDAASDTVSLVRNHVY